MAALWEGCMDMLTITLGTGHHSLDGLKAKVECASSPVNSAVDAGGSFIAYVRVDDSQNTRQG
jgi:hypothetical protein